MNWQMYNYSLDVVKVYIIFIGLDQEMTNPINKTIH